MATTTPNFGWPVPTSTDLVKNGATAIEALGDAIDASMVDLEGGTSGQILAKNSNTDMDFVWITNDVGDITAVTAGTGLTGGGTSGAVSLAFDQANFGGAQGAAGKNAIINGNFDIWQRGTTFTTDTAATFIYTADRWSARALFPGNSAVQVLTQETVNVPVGSKYSLKSVIATGVPVSGDRMNIAYTMENIDAIAYAGKTMTLSFQAKGIGNVNRIVSNAGYNTAGGISAAGTNITQQSNTINNSTFTTFTMTFTVPSAATITSTGTLGIYFSYNRNGGGETIGEGVYLSQVQLELGSVATVFNRNASTLQGELVACQRYYETSFDQGQTIASNSTNQGTIFIAANNGGFVPNNVYAGWSYKVTKRATPTIVLYNPVNASAAASTVRVYSAGGTGADAASGVLWTNTNQVNQNVTVVGTLTSAMVSFAYSASAEL